MPRKSILITGCSSGIGYDAAHTLARRGWRVFASCRSVADCERLRAEGLESPHLDMADPKSIETALQQILDATDGTLDALYNNAAFGIPSLVEDLPTDALREIFETNLFGLHDLTRRVIPVMRTQGHGRIVNCSSVLGYTACSWRGAYVATKYALEGLTDTLRVEMRGTNIHVCLIEPGLITTKFGENSARNFERLIDWKRSARAADYKNVVLRKAKGGNPHAKLEAPASDVTAKLIRALDAPRPRARYRITRLAQLLYVLKRILPTRAADWIISRV